MLSRASGASAPSCEAVRTRLPRAVHRPFTTAEIPAAVAVVTAAVTIGTSYLLDRVGLAFRPSLMLVIAATVAVGSAWWLRRASMPSRPGETAVGVIVTVATVAWLLWQARPWLLPVGTGPDLTHHLLLIDYIERHWRLVHGPGVEPYLGEMVSYTPGLHILAALTGAWTRLDGLHTLHTLLSLTVALKVTFVYLIVLRTVSGPVPRLALGVCATCLLAVPRTYVLDSFLVGSYLAQVASELFAVAMWWAVLVWDQSPSLRAAACFAAGAIATFLTWPMWIAPPTAALAIVLLARRDVAGRTRLAHAAAALGPPLAVALLYIAGRVAWLGMANSGGVALAPRVAFFGWAFLVVAGGGLAIALRHRAARATVALLGATAVQATTLAAWAAVTHNRSFYMAFKTFHLFPYPLAVMAALTLSVGWTAAGRLVGASAASSFLGRRAARVASLAVVALVFRMTVWPLLDRQRPVPPLSEPVFRAGAWARAQLPHACIEYLVPDDDTAYWLHLAVLGNPRWSERSTADATYDFGAALVRWLEPGGRPYAIADLSAIPRGVRDELQLLALFDSAAVVTRRGSACPDRNAPARP